MKEADVSGYMHNGEWDLLGETDDWRNEGVLWGTDKLLSNGSHLTLKTDGFEYVMF